jgi:chromosome segregation ATPase
MIKILLVILRKYMAKIKTVNDQGEEIEIEAFTEEEVNAKLQEKEEEYSKVIEEKDSTLEELKKEQEEIASKVDGTKEDNPNFKILKEALSKKDAEIEDIRQSIERDKEKRELSTLVTKASRGNDELEKKINFHLENTVAGMKAETPEDLAKKVDAAVKLSQDIGTEGMFDGGISGGGQGGEIKDTSYGGAQFTQNEIALGNKLGITDEDRKKYGSKLK